MMWKRIHNTEYFLSHSDSSKIFVTNYISIWYKVFSDESFAACLRESNDGLKMPEKEMIERAKVLLCDPSDLRSCRENIYGGTLVLTLIKSFGFLIKLKLQLTEGSKELRITLPLLKTVEDLRGSEAELKRLLQKKDQEIEEYKCEGGEIVLRHLKTVPFNEETHVVKHTVFQEHFAADEVPPCLLSKAVDVPEERTKPEPTLANKASNVKAEPKTEVTIENHLSSNIPLQVPLKNETRSQPIETVMKSEPLSQQSTASGASPSKRQRKKLNL